MPRINKCIDLIEEDQAIFSISAPELTYECGKEMSQTWADMIQFDFEHHPFNTASTASFTLMPEGLTRLPCSLPPLGTCTRQLAEIGAFLKVFEGEEAKENRLLFGGWTPPIICGKLILGR